MNSAEGQGDPGEEWSIRKADDNIGRASSQGWDRYANIWIGRSDFDTVEDTCDAIRLSTSLAGKEIVINVRRK
jgi:hypothetical protein